VEKKAVIGQRITLAIVLTACVTVSGRPVQAACNPQDVRNTADQLRIARQELLAAPAGDTPDTITTSVAPETQGAVEVMKGSLAAFVDAYMQCAPPEVTAEKMNKDLSRLGHAFKLANWSHSPAELPKDALRYGFELSYQARRWKDHPTIASITATLQIQCGEDSLFMVFDSSHGGWHELLRWQAPPYSEVSGAYGSFGYRISPPDNRGAWYVLVKSIPPWCSSTWASIRYAVLRPARDTLAPRVIYSGNEGIWWGSEDFGHLRARQSDFEVRFHNQSIDVGVHNRVWIKRFSILGDEVRRIQPVALSPRDFADEWITEPWDEASEWTAPELRSDRVKALHERLHAIRYFEFDSVRKCMDRPDHHQVGVVDSDAGSSYFFSVDGKSSFVMTGVAESPGARCNGPNLL
jgi:hypothetical protein